MHYGSKEEEEEEEEWRMQNVETRRHQHQPPKNYFPFVKLPSLVRKVTLICTKDGKPR